MNKNNVLLTFAPNHESVDGDAVSERGGGGAEALTDGVHVGEHGAAAAVLLLLLLLLLLLSLGLPCFTAVREKVTVKIRGNTCCQAEVYCLEDAVESSPRAMCLARRQEKPILRGFDPRCICLRRSPDHETVKVVVVVVGTIFNFIFLDRTNFIQ